MKLEVGMYLRHSGLEGEYTIIQKITELKTPGRCGGKYKVYTDKCEDWFINSDYIELNKSKYSHNIIDLIKVGDYVNGVMVESMNNSIKPIPIPQYKNECGEYIDFDESEIKSIVTKEQFEVMKYEIK